MTQSTCHEAHDLVHGPRRESYGHPADDYARTVATFNALTGRDLSASEGVLFMLCVKLSREMHAPKRDNRVDICGYAECLELIEQHARDRFTLEDMIRVRTGAEQARDKVTA